MLDYVAYCSRGAKTMTFTRCLFVTRFSVHPAHTYSTMPPSTRYTLQVPRVCAAELELLNVS
jgi:hypothetical protein